MQRPLSDDPATDQSLVASLPAPAANREPEYEIASIGRAMRPLRLPFAPMWPSSGMITTYFGEVGPYSPHGHAGLDIANDVGTPVLAADEGEVLKATMNGEFGYGELIVIGHPSGYETWYGHLSHIDVDTGEHVSKGATIGRIGSTGLSTGPHLHFEVRLDGDVRDPLLFLAESALKPAH